MNICEHLMTKLIVFCLLVGVVLLSGAPPVVAQNVNIPDANLRKAINKALGANREATAVVTEAEMKTLTSLSAGGYDEAAGTWRYVSDLTGLEKATNLTSLSLEGWVIDISAVSGLTNLTSLELRGLFTDISAVSGLTNLTTLDLGGRFTDISAVSGLTNLTTLDLGGSSLTDISAVSNLTNLTTLRLSGSFTDISAVSGLTNLTYLELWHTSVSDISHLSDLTNLTTLFLSLSRVSDISHLSDLTKLQRLDLSGNRISDISHLSELTVAAVDLSGNLLSYPSIYTHIPALQARGMPVAFTNRVPTTLTKVSGDAQAGATSTALANPFVVEVKDGGPARRRQVNGGAVSLLSGPDPFAGVPVTFAVTAGGGTLSATSVATDATGRAQVTLTPGATAATQTVTATVTHAGRTLTQTFTATANRLPTLTSAATFSVAENSSTVGTVVATDADSQDSVTYAITGGVDSAKFAITNAGVLTFAAAPDYEGPGDLVSTTPANAAGNNEYVIIVTATSGTGVRQLTATQTLTITVTNVPPPGKPAAPTLTNVAATPTSLSVNWTAATNTGPAITYNLRYRKSSEVSWTSATYADSAVSTTLTGLSPGTSYEVQVLAKNSEGDGPWSESGTGTTAYQAEDIDSDGDVDIDDLVSVISNFGSASPGRNDVDSDGDVDADDIRAVFAALVAANAGAPAHLTHTAKTLQDYVQQAEQRGMLDANFQQGLAVLEALLEPFLIPNETALLRNYPNPFNPETWLPYQLSKPADVTFSIYSVDGRLVRTLSLGYQAAGVYRHRSRAAYWDGRNALGEPVASGVYFYTLTAGEFIATGKMLIRK